MRMKTWILISRSGGLGSRVLGVQEKIKMGQLGSSSSSSSLVAMILVLNVLVVCNGGKTSTFVRKVEKTPDMPLDSDVFRIPPGYNAPQQVLISPFFCYFPVISLQIKPAIIFLGAFFLLQYFVQVFRLYSVCKRKSVCPIAFRLACVCWGEGGDRKNHSING